MRRNRIAFFLTLLISTPPIAQGQRVATGDRDVIVAFAQKAALQAVNFRQRDIASLARSRPNFTADAWKDYMKHMEGFLDQKGAPTFGSSFVPSENPMVLGEEKGIVHVRILGTLKQTQNLSSTIYRGAAIDVFAGGHPIRIQRLEQLTCGGAGCQFPPR
jgi:hypothetical protein